MARTSTASGAVRAAYTPDSFVFGRDRRLACRGQMDASRPGNGRSNDGADLRAASTPSWPGSCPIVVFEPFLASSADEKMFRVVGDRERWFQVVMGQKFEFDEAAAEQLAGRVPLPEELARELIFDLAPATPPRPPLPSPAPTRAAPSLSGDVQP